MAATNMYNREIVTKKCWLGFDVICIRINGVDYADFNESDKWLPINWRTGSIRIEPINPRRMNEFTVGKFVDIDNYIEFKILKPTIDPKTDSPMFDLLRINSTKEFNLANKVERAKAFIWVHQPIIDGGPMSTSLGFLKITSIVEQAKTNRSNRRKTSEIFGIIEKLSGQDLRDFARLLVPVNDKEDDDVIKDRLEEVGIENPEAILKEFRRTDRNLAETFKRANDYGIIVFRNDMGFSYNGNGIGYSELDVLNNFKANTQLMRSIHEETMRVISRRINKGVGTQEQNDRLNNILGHSKNDRSISDALYIDRLKQEHQKDQGGDFAKMLEQIEKTLKSSIDEKLEPLKQQMVNVENRMKSLDAINLDENSVSDMPINEQKVELIEQKIELEIEKLSNGLLNGKPILEWKLRDLKNYCINTMDSSEYATVINAPRETLFDWIVKQNLTKLNAGIYSV